MTMCYMKTVDVIFKVTNKPPVFDSLISVNYTSLGLNDIYKFNENNNIKLPKIDMNAKLSSFIDNLSRPTPTPGGVEKCNCFRWGNR